MDLSLIDLSHEFNLIARSKSCGTLNISKYNVNQFIVSLSITNVL